jgi:hypothetical protein
MKNRKSPRASRLAVLIVFVAAAALALVSPAATGQNKRVRDEIAQSLASFDELSIDTTAALKQARASGTLTLQTSIGQLDLRLEPYDIRTDDYRSVAVGADGVARNLPREESHAFEATVAGMSDARARFIIEADQLEGVIAMPDETYYVEPASHFSKSAASGDFVFYAASSLKAENAGECGTTLAQKVSVQGAGAQGGEAHSASKLFKTATAFAPKEQAIVATESDFEFTQTFGGDANATNTDILHVLTLVDGVYDAQLGIKLKVNFQRAWTANNDPYTLTASNTALDEFKNAYDNSFSPSQPPTRDLVQMFTGKDFDGNTIGIAYIGAVCVAPDFAFSIVQSKFGGAGTGNLNDTVTVERVGLSAHEMGHNFGASHPDQDTNVTPACSSGQSIMNSSIQPTTNFCQFSRDEITSLITETSCLARLTQTGCSYTLSTSSQGIPATGGSSSVGVTTGAGCNWDVAEGVPWLTVTGGAPGSGPGAATYSVDPNTASGPRETTLVVGDQKLSVHQGSSPTCLAASSQIAIGQTLNGGLDTNDCASGQPDRVNAFADLYTFAGRAGQRVKIEMTSTSSTSTLDTFLYLFGPDNSVVAFNDDIDPGVVTNSRIPDPTSSTDAFFTLPQTGIYIIEATSFDNQQNNTGGYSLKLSDNSSSNTVALSSSAYSVGEAVAAGGLGTDGSGFRVVTVTRSGSDLTGTATVNYATSNGTADKHGDYEQTLGTLVFAPGETSKTFTVFVDDDRYAEQPETVNITLSNPVGTTLGTPSAATLTINSNPRDASNNPSPVRWDSNFDTGFFVRQQYLDFLNREPDASGFQFWSNDINNCGADANCAQVHRVNVSAAFFLSIEFQETGYLVERMYKTAFGDATGNSTLGGAHTLAVPAVRLDQFLPDTQRIGQGVVVGQGDWQTQLENNKNAFALEFVLRPAFISAFPLSTTPAAFVDKLNQNAGSVLTQAQRDQLVAQLSASADTGAGRASVLRQVAENSVLKANESNRAFVLMQYIGYLRRNPNDAPDADYTGYEFWLQKLNQFGGDFVKAQMVTAFITSTEYVNRFGS